MYESPIKMIMTDIQTQIVKQQENDIYQAVQKYGVVVDKEELFKALQYDREQYTKGYEDDRIDLLLKVLSDRNAELMTKLREL